MDSSGSVASDFNSARCLGVNRLEVPFFMGSPFASGGLAGADDAADRLAIVGLHRPSMNHER
jgi:hypothetical protein